MDKLESNAHATPMTYLGKKTEKQFVVVAVGPGGYFNPDTSAPTVLAAYACSQKDKVRRGCERRLTRERFRRVRDVSPRIFPHPPRRLPSRFRSVTGSTFRLGLKCDICHQAAGNQRQDANPGSRGMYGLPPDASRRRALQSRELARIQKDDDLIAWKPVYTLPDFVYFSHQKHPMPTWNARCATAR